MHGRNRAEYKSRLLDPTASAALARKAESYNSLSRKILLLRGQQQRQQQQQAGDVKDDVDDGAEGTETSLSLTGKILSANPDPGHLWNYRRELLLRRAGFNVPDELELTASCLRRNPKAYGAWFHRKWSVRRFCHLAAEANGGKNGDGEGDGGGEDDADATAEDVLSSELDLCGEFLSLDERNFHCWNYRRFVVSALAYHRLGTRTRCSALEDDGATVAVVRCDGSWSWAGPTAPTDNGASRMIMGPQLAPSSAPGVGHEKLASAGTDPVAASISEDLLRTEWDFTTSKISHNFSNCSSFHYRSKLLPFVLRSRLAEESAGHVSGDDDDEEYYATVLDLAREELETIHQALYTEPDDQTPWWYHRHILLTFASPRRDRGREEGGEVDGDDWLDGSAVEMYADLLREEEDVARELIEAEDGRCKWGLLALHDLLTTRVGLLPVVSAADGGDDGGGDDEEVEEMRDEATACLARLEEIDPDRAGRYRSMMASTEKCTGQ